MLENFKQLVLKLQTSNKLCDDDQEKGVNKYANSSKYECTRIENLRSWPFYNMLSARAGNRLKKLLGADGILLLNLGCLSMNNPTSKVTILKGVIYRATAAQRQSSMKMLVALGSLQLKSE